MPTGTRRTIRPYPARSPCRATRARPRATCSTNRARWSSHVTYPATTSTACTASSTSSRTSGERSGEPVPPARRCDRPDHQERAERDEVDGELVHLLDRHHALGKLAKRALELTGAG